MAELDAHWQSLDLPAGSSLEAIEAAYAQRCFELARAGDKAALAQLKVAYKTLKAQLETQPGADDPAGNTMAAAEGREISPEEKAARGLLADLNLALDPRGWQAREVRRRGEEWQILLEARQVPKAAIATAAVGLALQSLGRDDLQAVRVAALKTQLGKPQTVWVRALQVPSPMQEDCKRFGYENPMTNALALPVAAFVAWMLLLTGISQLLLGFDIWVHEFGHATVAWLAGYRALPLPFGWTSTSAERSLFVYCGVLILLLLLFWRARAERIHWLQGAVAVAIVLQFYMTWRLSVFRWGEWMAFGGIGGEFYLSALMIIGFYFRLPDRWRWDFYRFPVLVLGTLTFWKNFWRWHRIELGRERIPFGSMLGGEGDASGDMNRLMDIYNWTGFDIVRTYSSLGDFCLLAIVATYIVFLIKLNPQQWFSWRHRVVLWLGGDRA